MKIAKSKKLEDMGLMEEKEKQMGKELDDLRLKESIMKEKLQLENKKFKEPKEKEAQLAIMVSLSPEAIHCRQPSKSYAIFLKEQWL